MPRRLAFDVLQRVEEGSYSHIALSNALERANLSPSDRGLATQLVYGTLTWQRALDDVLHVRLKSGIKSVGTDGRILLRLGAFQILFLDRIPDHAVLNETVNLAHDLTPELVPVINAVLRRLVREMPTWWDENDRKKKPARYLGQRWSVPNWLANRMVQTMGGVDRAEPILEAMVAAPPLWFRSLRGEPVPDATPHETVPDAWRAQTTTPAISEGLKNAQWSVQDIAAQLVGWMASGGLPAGSTVLDACAGLGGKALHLASLGHHVTAVDPNATKIGMLLEAVARANAAGSRWSVATHVQRAEETTGEFDCVLVDAPCSGLGTIRRHPETRWSKSEADITQLAEIQANILDAIVDRVKPGGVLVYSVCTWTREETSKQVEKFLERHPDFELAAPVASGFDWEPFMKDRYLSLNAAAHDADGFFAARMIRSKA